jgi:hypothetical protein
MENLVIAIVMALNSFASASGEPATTMTQEERVEKAQYILDNDLYRESDGGVIIDPGVSV